jgi:probable HAF family extracellular repeat protein
MVVFRINIVRDRLGEVPELCNKGARTMNRPRFLGLVMVAAVLASMLSNPTPVSAEVRYAVTDLSAILENSFAEPERVTHWAATAINDHGQIAGYAETTDNSTFAFVWDAVNGLRDLSHLDKATQAYAIDNLGQAAITGPTAYLWDRNTGLREIVGWGSGPIVATGINDLGMVVGMHWPDKDLSHAFLWQDGTMQDLGNLGSQPAEAYALNSRGQIVGWSETPGWAHAFLWGAENGMQDLGSLGRGSIASDIDNAGQVVGYSGTGARGQRAFLWEAGDMFCIDTLGGESSTAASINDCGEVVGTWQLPEYTGISSFLWNRTDGMVDMNSLIAPESGYQIVQAFDINDAGYVVATAVGTDDAGNRHSGSVLLRPVPEASAVLLLSTALISLSTHMWFMSLKKRNGR